MRSRVLSNRIGFLKKACSVGVLATVVAGCSSGFQRFDNNFYQSAVPQAPASASNNYSQYQGTQGNLDAITTASVQRGPRRLAPLANVTPPQYPQQVYHTPEPTYVAPQASYQPPQPYSAPSAYRPPASNQIVRKPYVNYNAPTYAAPAQPTYTPPATSTWQSAKVSGTTLRPAAPKPSYKQPAYTPPKPQPVSNPEDVYIGPRKADPLTTASVRQPIAYAAQPSIQQKIAPANQRDGGWTSAGGTTITVREGETLYNLSKRYGVPVEAIQQANNMSASRGLQSGQRLVIPNYVFSASAPISAPDNNPKTRAARASTGYLGEAAPSNLAIPTKRPYHVASIAPQNTQASTNNAVYIQPKSVDPVVTNSVPRNSGVAQVDTTTRAPASSGISQFRWPVQGRVVSQFGQSGGIGSNEGIDISVPEGTAVKAAENGVVIYAGDEISSYGNLILIRHDNDFVSAYAHARDFNVRKGDKVVRGQTIARSGKTGSADRPKLHFELRKGSKPVDPRQYLAG